MINQFLMMKGDMLKLGQEVDLNSRENKDSFIRNRSNSSR